MKDPPLNLYIPTSLSIVIDYVSKNCVLVSLNAKLRGDLFEHLVKYNQCDVLFFS